MHTNAPQTAHAHRLKLRQRLDGRRRPGSAAHLVRDCEKAFVGELGKQCGVPLLLGRAGKLEVVASAQLRVGGKSEARQQTVHAGDSGCDDSGCDARILKTSTGCCSKVLTLRHRVRKMVAKKRLGRTRAVRTRGGGGRARSRDPAADGRRASLGTLCFKSFAFRFGLACSNQLLRIDGQRCKTRLAVLHLSVDKRSLLCGSTCAGLHLTYTSICPVT